MSLHKIFRIFSSNNLVLFYMLLLKITMKIHWKPISLIGYRITFQIASFHNWCCPIATDVSPRKKIIQEKSKYYNFFKTGHSVKTCTSQNRCFACKKHYQISMQGSKIYPVKKDNACENQALQNEIINSKDNIEPGRNSTILWIDHSSKKIPFANCTSLNLLHKRGNDKFNQIKKRILFYSCSQKSFITKQLKK